MWRKGIFPKEMVEGAQLEKREEGMHLRKRDTEVRTGSSEKEGRQSDFHLCDKVHHNRIIRKEDLVFLTVEGFSPWLIWLLTLRPQPQVHA